MANIAYEIDRKDFERFLAENPDRVFDQNSVEHCAIAEYLVASGLTKPFITHTTFSAKDISCHALPEWAVGVTRLKQPERSAWETYPFTARQILDFLATMPEDSHA